MSFRRGSHWLLWIFLLASPLFTAALPATIRGKALGLEGKTIRLIEYRDRVSYLEVESGNTVIGNDGSFSLQFDARAVTPVIIAVGYYRGNIIIEPDGRYELDIQLVDFHDSGGGLLNPGYLSIGFSSPEETRLNGMINKLETGIDSFISAEYEGIFLQRDRSIMRQYISWLDSAYAGFNHSYFRTYLKYTLGYLESLCYCRSWQSINNRYFRNIRVAYENPAYMELFNTQFDKYFLNHSPVVNLDSLVKLVNRDAGLDAIISMIDADTLFRTNARLGELVKVKMFHDMLSSIYFDKEQVVAKLSRYLHTLRYPENSLVAQGILEKYRSISPGGQAPKLTGVTSNGESFDLSDLKGKRVFLVFWNQYCLSCREEFNVMAPLAAERSDTLCIVAVFMDDGEAYFKQSIQGLAPGITYVKPDDVYAISRDYHINSIPVHVLIDPQGILLENPSVGPMVDFNLFLVRVIGRK